MYMYIYIYINLFHIYAFYFKLCFFFLKDPPNDATSDKPFRASQATPLWRKAPNSLTQWNWSVQKQNMGESPGKCDFMGLSGV